MFTHSKTESSASSELIELKSWNNTNAINIEEKLRQLSAVEPSEYNRRFQNAYSNYMCHRSSVINIKGALFGFGCMMENMGTRPYMYYLEQRISEKNCTKQIKNYCCF